jgi:Ca2+-binding EF-hand superfamily protein
LLYGRALPVDAPHSPCGRAVPRRTARSRKATANAGASGLGLVNTADVPAIHKLMVPLALLFGACDTEAPDDADEVEVAAEASTEREARYAGKFAKLDVDGDGSISKTEIASHKMAPLFDEIDGDGNGLLSKDEFLAAKKARHGKGKRGDHGDPAQHAAKMIEKLDADKDGTLSLTEIEGHRFLGDKFTEVDTDSDGKLTAAELTAFKATHHGRKHGGKHGKRGGDRDAQPEAQPEPEAHG